MQDMPRRFDTRSKAGHLVGRGFGVSMKRYTTRAAGWDDPTFRDVSSRDVIVVSDDSPQDTGLLDAAGNKLYRLYERDPIGFDLRGSRHEA